MENNIEEKAWQYLTETTGYFDETVLSHTLTFMSGYNSCLEDVVKVIEEEKIYDSSNQREYGWNDCIEHLLTKLKNQPK